MKKNKKVYFNAIPLDNILPANTKFAEGAEITLPTGETITYKKGMMIIPEFDIVADLKDSKTKLVIKSKVFKEDKRDYSLEDVDMGKFVPVADYKDICKSCRGKGYSTNYHGIEGAEDLDYVGFKTDLTVHLEYCFCARGKQLEEMIKAKQKEANLLLLRRIFTNVKRKKQEISKLSVMEMLRGYWKLVYNEKA